MPPKKGRRKKGKRRTKTEAVVEVVADEKQNLEITPEQILLQEEAQREMARLVEVKQKWKARMRKYVTFVTLGIPTTQSHIRRRRNSYLLASGMTASERRQSITTTIVEQQPHFPLAFKVLTPQYNSFSSEVVIDINSQETLKSIEQRLMQEVGPQRLPEHDGSEKIEVPETPTPETITEVTIEPEPEKPEEEKEVVPIIEALKVKDDPAFTKYFKMLEKGLPKQAVAAKMMSDEADPAILDMDPDDVSPNHIVVKVEEVVKEIEIVTVKKSTKSTTETRTDLSFFYTPPGSLQRRRLETESEWKWALKDFHGRRSAVTLVGMHDYSKKILSRLTEHGRSSEGAASSTTTTTTTEKVESIHQLWQFATFIDAHHYISRKEIDLLCKQLKQHKRFSARSAAAGCLWAVAYNHHLRRQIHLSDVLVNTLTNPQFLQSLNNFADTDKESLRLHTYIFGLLACILSEGQLSADDVMGDGGTSLLGTYLRVAPGGSTTPQGTRLAAQALLDSCLRSVSAQHRMGRASNDEVVAQAEADVIAAQDDANKKNESKENAALLGETTTPLSSTPEDFQNDTLGDETGTNNTTMPVTKVNIAAILGKCLTSIKDSETFHHVLEIVVLSSRSPSEELRDALCTTTTSAGYSVAASLLQILNDIQIGTNQYLNMTPNKKADLLVRVLAALWGVLEAASRSFIARKRGNLMPGVASPIDVAVEMLHLARSLASNKNRDRSKITTKQQAYCAVNCVMCLVDAVVEEETSIGEGEESDVAIQIFSDLCSLYDEAQNDKLVGLRQSSAPTIQPPDKSCFGHGWASVRRRSACTMALLTSSSPILCQDLSAAGYFERLVSLVEEEQIQEKRTIDLQRRKSLFQSILHTNDHKDDVEMLNTHSNNSGETTESTETNKKKEQKQKLKQKTFTSKDSKEPTGCEWLLRALANMAGTESAEPLATTIIETCCRLLLDPTSSRKNVVRPVGDGLDSVILLLWRLARRFKDHRLSMMLDSSVINLLLQAATAAYKIGRVTTVESVLSLLHLLISDITDEREEDVRKGEVPKGICYVQSLPVSIFQGWVSFLLGLVQECCGDSAFKSSTKLLVRTRTIKTTANAMTVATASNGDAGNNNSTAAPPSSGNSIRRPGFGGRTTRNPQSGGDGASGSSGNGNGSGTTKRQQVQVPEVLRGSSYVSDTDKRCRVWTLAITNLWTMSVSRSLGFQMLDGGVPAMLTRLCLERGARLTPLLRIRAAGCAMSMAMQREYSDFYQSVTGSVKGASIDPSEPGTAAAAATRSFIAKSPPVGTGRPKFAEILAVTLLHMDDYDLRCYGATCIARLAVSQKKRKESIVILGGVDLLIEQLDRSSNREQFTEFATQAVLNLSTYGPNQKYICECCKGVGLRRMLNMVRDPSRPRCATYAQAVLSNVARHPANRTKLYRAELHSSVDVTYGAMQDSPVRSFNSGIKGRLGLRLAEAGLGGNNTGVGSLNEFGDSESMEGGIGGSSSSTTKYKSKSKKAAARFNTWFTSEIEKELTEQQIISLRRLEGEHGIDSNSDRKNKHAKRQNSPRLISEHIRQLNLRAIPVPYKIVTDAAQRNLQNNMCRPLSDLWQSNNKQVPTVKQLAMTASMQAGALTLTPGVEDGPALDPTWMDPSSRAVLRWAPMIHAIVETDKNEADAKRKGVRLSSGRRAEQYQNAPPDMTVVLEPRQSPRNQVKFKEGGMMSKNKARLAVWTHIEGSKASAGLFPQYTLPSGERAFFYEHAGMHEAVFPPELPPTPPLTEEAFGAPVPLSKVSAVAPNWEKDPPLLRCQPAPKPPPCPTTHPGSGSIKSSTSKRSEGNGKGKGQGNNQKDHDWKHTLEGVLTNLSEESSHRVISFSIAHRAHLGSTAEVSNSQLNITNSGWNLEGSVFAPRPYESDSSSFWDEAWVRGAAFNIDWSRALRKQSFRNFICSTHGAGRCAFVPGDEVEVNSEDLTYWFPATVTEISRGPSLTVQYADRSYDRSVALSRARFPGGQPSGYGGRCRRWSSPRTETMTILLSEEILPDIVGFNGSEIRRMRSESGCKITVKQNGTFYSLEAIGVAENLQILQEIVQDIEELALVRQALRHNFDVGIATFNLFRSSGSKHQFSIQSNEYGNFVDQCGIVELHSSTCSRSHLSNIFKIVNIEESAHDAEDRKLNSFNNDRSIVRYEWLELLVRIAQAKYGGEASGLDECIEMLFHRNIEPFLGTLGEMDHNIFRDACLYTQSTDQVLRSKLPFLISVFTGAINANRTGGMTRKREVLMSLPGWLLFLRSYGLITSQFSNVEAKFCFHSSKLLVIDDVNQKDRARMITFVEFLEALCRITDIMFLPTQVQIDNSGHEDFHTYHLHVKTHGDREEHKVARAKKTSLNNSANQHYLHRRHLDKRPLSERLLMFLELLQTRGGKRGSLIRRRRIAAWYSDKKYEVTRNAAHDIKSKNGIVLMEFDTTAKSLVASKTAPTLVFVPKRPTGKKSRGREKGDVVRDE